MFTRKCRGCGEKVDRKFNYCPKCGAGLKVKSDGGMLGENDVGNLINDAKLPFGLEKVMGGLMKQLEKQLNDMDFDERGGMPKGVKIKIGRMPSGGNQVVQSSPRMKKDVVVVSKEESERRAGLKRVKAESRVKRLGDVIIYEIEAPGVLGEEDVVVSELETGIEIRAFAKDRCYVKVIPLKVEVLSVKAGKDKVSVELRG